MFRLFVFLFCCAAFAQQPTFRLAPPSQFRTGYVISPANGDRSARSPEEIDAINQKLAKSGNMDAAFELGLAYMQGLGVKEDPAQAEKWFAIGAVKPEDKELLAMFYRAGYLPQDATKAEHWYRSAGRPGDLFELAQMFRQATPAQYQQAAAIYVELLKQTGHPEVRRAQLELGNFVLDGRYSVGDTPEAHAQNLAWARAITQELLGQQEYTIAVAYDAQVDGVPKDAAMWRRFCKRAAAYNMDLAQEFYAKAILEGQVPRTSPLEGYAWMRLSADKRYSNRQAVRQMEGHLSPDQQHEANSIFDGLQATRERDGAYYSIDDPLREPSSEQLASMPDDDPDVQVRRAFALENSNDPAAYEKALRLYRIARDRWGIDIKAVLGRDYLQGSHDIQKDPRLAKYWLTSAAQAGSHPAALYLAQWYQGSGGGTPDAVQARAWTPIGTEPAGSAPAASGLTAEQQEAAQKIYSAWLSAHPGWEAQPR